MLTRKQISDALYDAGLRPGDSVMLHSSFKSLGGVEGGPDAVIDAFLDVLGPDGTLLVPTLIFNGGHYEFLRNYPPDVDLRVTPSLMGVITEFVRKRPAAVRSIHPTHPAAAIGGRAAELCGRHHLDDSAVGANSPWALNARAGGWIVLLGVTHRVNTTFHHVEETCTDWALTDFHFQVRFTDTAGQQRDFSIRAHAPAGRRNYEKAEPMFLAKGIQKNVTIGSATVRLVRAGQMVELLKEVVKRDPWYVLAEPPPNRDYPRPPFD